LGTEKNDTQKVVEAFMQEIRTSMYNGDNVYLRGFGSLSLKQELLKQVETFLKTLQLKSLLITFLLSNLQKLLLRK
jgi:DNA-binding protein HU-beta